MEKESLNKEEQMERSLHNSFNIFRKKTNNLSIEEHRNYIKKRSSSMLLNSPTKFVPKLKPIKANISPSPIKLNQKYPPTSAPEIQNSIISKASFDSQNDSNLKTIKYIYSRRYRPKKSFKIINIEEEIYAVSDCENSDFSKSDKESDNNLNKYNKNNKFDYFLNNIKIMRKNMAKIKKNFINNENLLDDSKIDNNFVGKRFNHFKSNDKDNLINTIRKKKILYPLKKIKYRTKSFSIEQRYVHTILGFLEKNNSTNSLNSNGK